MICPKCNKEYSDKVYTIHKNICKVVEEPAGETLETLKDKYTVEELRAIAKENGIEKYWVKKEETLIEELKEVL